MDERFYSIASLIFAAFFFVLLFRLYFKERSSKDFDYSRLVARAAIFGGISTVLYVVPVFQIHLPFFPSFLAIHFDEIPLFIAGFAYGPLTAFVVLCVKTLIKLPFTSTLCVGEVTDFLLSAIFILPAAMIYKKKRTLQGFFIGAGVGLLCQNVGALLFNIYVMLPFYIFVMGFQESQLLALCQMANASVSDLGWSYGFFCVLPLNLLKDGLVLLVTFFVYKALHKALRFEGKK